MEAPKVRDARNIDCLQRKPTGSEEEAANEETMMVESKGTEVRLLKPLGTSTDVP